MQPDRWFGAGSAEGADAGARAAVVVLGGDGFAVRTALATGASRSPRSLCCTGEVPQGALVILSIA